MSETSLVFSSCIIVRCEHFAFGIMIDQDDLSIHFLHLSKFISCSLVHAYAVARDMRGALSCIDEMRTEGVELTVATYSILIAGFAKVLDAE